MRLLMFQWWILDTLYPLYLRLQFSGLSRGYDGMFWLGEFVEQQQLLSCSLAGSDSLFRRYKSVQSANSTADCNYCSYYLQTLSFISAAS